MQEMELAAVPGKASGTLLDTGRECPDMVGNQWQTSGRVRKMKDQPEQSKGETSRKEKREAEEARRLGKETERRQAYLAKEQALEKASQAKEAERAKKRADEESGQLAREQVRKKAYADMEKKTAEAQDARRLRDEAR
jgi:hypothetical protein